MAAVAALRAGMVSIFDATLHKIMPSENSYIMFATQIEHAIHTKFAGVQYVGSARIINTIIGQQNGIFPDEIPGIMFLDGRITVDRLVALCLTPIELDPREIIRRMFVRTLLNAETMTRENIVNTARAIESSCFNAAVRISKMSEDPPRRQWDSSAFVDIYGTRCGAINGLLDPQSSVCKTYGASLLHRLQNGTIMADTLGDMPARELCPEAMDVERAEIAKRATQKVKLKESSLFRCPHCGERRCTYQEVQRRSLDEAPDYLCLCLNCNRRFTGRS